MSANKKNHTREWTFGMKILHNKRRWQIHKEIRGKMKPVFHGSHYSVVLKRPIEIVPPKIEIRLIHMTLFHSSDRFFMYSMNYEMVLTHLEHGRQKVSLLARIRLLFLVYLTSHAHHSGSAFWQYTYTVKIDTPSL